MRTVLVIASAIVNAILRAAHTATRTGQAPGGARCAAVRVLGKHRAVPGAQPCAYWASTGRCPVRSDARTGQAPGGARCAAMRVLGKHRAVPGAQRCAYWASTGR